MNIANCPVCSRSVSSDRANPRKLALHTRPDFVTVAFMDDGSPVRRETVVVCEGSSPGARP